MSITDTPALNLLASPVAERYANSPPQGRSANAHPIARCGSVGPPAA